MTSTINITNIISTIANLSNASLPERVDIMRKLAFESRDFGDDVISEAARTLWATHCSVSTYGTDNEVLCALRFGRAILERLNLRNSDAALPLRSWLAYMTSHGPEAQPDAVVRYTHPNPDTNQHLMALASGAVGGPDLRAADIMQTSALLPGMESRTADMPVVVCPHCQRLTPVHTAMLNGNAHIHGAYHCPHCGRLAWWRAFDPITGTLAPQVHIAAAVLTDVPTPMNRQAFYGAIKNVLVDADAIPVLFVDTDSRMADSAHPWHMHLFHLDAIAFERKEDMDDAYFGTCAWCATPVPCRDVTADGRIDEDDPEGWSAKINSSDSDLSDIQYLWDGRVYDIIICEDCRDSMGISCCEHCGVYVDDDDIVTVHARGYDIYECYECAKERYYRCEDCGDWFTDDFMHQNYAGDWYCSSCIEDHYYEEDGEEHHRIHDYGYKPTPIKHGNGINDTASKTGGAGESSYYLGWELEHSSEGHQWAMAEAFCQSICDDEEYVYMKHDGSVETGIEFVSHPATLAAWQDPFSKAQACLREVCDIAFEYSYDREDDGFHVHISRSAFYKPHDDVAGKKSWNVRHRACFDAFFNRIVKLPAAQRVIGRREVHWGKGNPQGCSLGAVVARFHKHEPFERYRAVNWNNHSTAEVRVFHSTDNLETVLACLEMVDAALHFTHPRRGGATQSHITGSKYPVEWLWDTFSEWVVRRESQYPHLAAALVEA